jgi:hypothetical protein
VHRYLVFTGNSYYAQGGWNDCIGSYEDLEEAKGAALARVDEELQDWAQVVDTTTLKIVAAREGAYCGKLFASDHDVEAL